jgi:metal transporter CNNM
MSTQQHFIQIPCFNAEACNKIESLLFSEGVDFVKDHARRLVEERDLSPDNIALYTVLSILCIVCAALAAGLTQGMLSLNPLELKIKLESGTESEKEAAKKILPIISEHHVLLVTLMLFNATANEALPIFLDQLLPPWLSILLSVTLVLMFGEIIPSAIFTGPNQLQIASFLAPFVKMLIFTLFPIGYPISLLLDYFLGHDDGMRIFYTI